MKDKWVRILPNNWTITSGWVGMMAKVTWDSKDPDYPVVSVEIPQPWRVTVGLQLYRHSVMVCHD